MKLNKWSKFNFALLIFNTVFVIVNCLKQDFILIVFGIIAVAMNTFVFYVDLDKLAKEQKKEEETF